MYRDVIAVHGVNFTRGASGEAPQISSYHITVATTLNGRGMHGWQSYKIPPRYTKIPKTCTHMYACTSHEEFVHRFATTSRLWRKGDSRRQQRQQLGICVAVLPGLEESIPRSLLRRSTRSLLQTGSQVVKSSLLPACCAARSSTARCNCHVGSLYVRAAYLALFAQHGHVHAHVAWRCTLLDHCSHSGASRACAECTGLFVRTLP